MKLRSVNTKFWDDPFVEGLKPIEKLLFLYFLTNPLTNVLGIYEISIKRISFDTGVDQKTITKALESFQRVNKVYYVHNHIILANFLKNQSMNDNMKTGAVNAWNDLTEDVKQLSDCEDIIKDFQRLLKALESFENININIKSNSKGKLNDESSDPAIISNKNTVGNELFLRVTDMIGNEIPEDQQKMLDEKFMVLQGRLDRVWGLPKPLTNQQYYDLVMRYGKKTVVDVLESMQNYKPLTKKVDAYLTANKWCRRELEEKG